LRYSAFSLLKGALSRHENWPRLWRAATPRKSYDAVIVGGGGHGLATAYYLAKNHGVANVAVLERGWIGGGATGRNTTIIRSNYMRPECARLYDASLDMWEGLSQELNFNLMVSQRGALTLAHNPHDVRELTRRLNADRAEGVDSDWLTPEQAKAFCPLLDISPRLRFPVHGAVLQQRAGTVRHDAVAWGYARAASDRGIDIIENCEVTAIHSEAGRAVGVETTKGRIDAPKIALAAAGMSSVLAAMVGLRLPIQTRALQAFVSEPVKPLIDCVVLSNTVHIYVSQSDKGELVLGAGTDMYNSYAQRGALSVIEEAVAAAVELFPALSSMRVMRIWAGMVDIAPDASPIIAKTEVDGLFVNCGWGTGGFKATPVSGRVYAHLIATGERHPLAADFTLDRFARGALLDEHSAANVAH
jgi:sarcosine oxidase subunit beta